MFPRFLGKLARLGRVSGGCILGTDGRYFAEGPIRSWTRASGIFRLFVLWV